MKSCRYRNYRPAGAGTPAVQNAAAQQPVNRYCHPIRTKGATRPSTTEELLSYILDALSHQADLLEELLRRTQGEDTKDTI